MDAAGFERVEERGDGSGQGGEEERASDGEVERGVRRGEKRAERGLVNHGEQLREAVAEVHALLRLLRRFLRLLRLFGGTFLADLRQRGLVETLLFLRALCRQTRLDRRVDRLRGDRRRRLLRLRLQALPGSGNVETDLERAEVDEGENGLEEVDVQEKSQRDAQTAIGASESSDLLGCLGLQGGPVSGERDRLRHTKHVYMRERERELCTLGDVLDLLVDAPREGQQRGGASSGRGSVELGLESDFELLGVVVKRSEELGKRLNQLRMVRFEVRRPEERHAEHLRHVGCVAVQMVHLGKRGNGETLRKWTRKEGRLRHREWR